MKLIKLSANQKSFRDINFNPSGLTLITGNKSDNNPNSLLGSSNGVGKTLALRLTNLCLGGQDQKLKSIASKLPDWVFKLQFSLQDGEHLVESSLDGKNIALDEKKVTLKQLRDFFNAKGPFSLGEAATSSLSFRSLVKRFIRQSPDDINDPIILPDEKRRPSEAVLRTLFLLGANYRLALNRISNQRQLKSINDFKRFLKNNPSIKNILASGENPRKMVDELTGQISTLSERMKNMEVFDAFEEVNVKCREAASSLQTLEHKKSVIKYQLAGIARSLKATPDITAKDLKELYTGLEFAFKKKALEHFDAVEKFHKDLMCNRVSRLTNDQTVMERKQKEIDSEIIILQDKIKKYESLLKGRYSNEQYVALASQLAEYKSQLSGIQNYINRASEIEKRVRSIQKQIIDDTNIAAQYANTTPLNFVSEYYRNLVKRYYPAASAGITLDEHGKGEQQFNLIVSVSQQLSDGINALRIMAFDWLLLTHGANHTMGFVWHDNALYANQDEEARAKWLRDMAQESQSLGKQYIGTINTENFESIKKYLTEPENKQLRESVVLELSGDKDANRLLGIKFDDH